MEKSFEHSELSDRKCNVCKKQLKKNLLAKNPDAELCYKHWVISKGLESRRESYQK